MAGVLTTTLAHEEASVPMCDQHEEPSSSGHLESSKHRGLAVTELPASSVAFLLNADYG